MTDPGYIFAGSSTVGINGPGRGGMPQLANKVHSIHWAGGDQGYACIVDYRTRVQYSSIECRYCMGSTLPK